MAYSNSATIASFTNPRGNGSINLSIGVDGASYLKSISPKYSNILNRVFTLTDGGDTFRSLATFDGIGLDRNLYTSTSMVICNESVQPIEIRISMTNVSESTDKVDGSTSTRHITSLLSPKEFLYLPNNLFFVYDIASSKSACIKEHTASSGTVAGFIDTDTASRPDSQTRVSAGLLSSGVLIDNVSNHSAGDTTLTVDTNYYFKINDVIGIIKDGTSTHEYLRVLGVPSSTTLTVERAVLGSSAGQLNNDTDIRLYYLNESNDTVVKTDSNGMYRTNSFCGYGRTSSNDPQGIQRGSVAIRVREPAHQEFGMTGQNASTSTGLSLSTSYDFKVTNDADTIQTITIITDGSNVTWGGTTGIINKINNAFSTLYKAGTFTYLPRISLINGDIRITSGSRLSTSAITLASGVSTNLFSGSAGRIPALASLLTSIATKMPETFETEKIIFDDGKGGLSGGQGKGEIDYETGAFELRTFSNAQFEISCYHSTALSGSTLHNTNQPRIGGISARSINPFRDAKIRVISFDPEEGDPRSATVTGQSGSGAGGR